MYMRKNLLAIGCSAILAISLVGANFQTASAQISNDGSEEAMEYYIDISQEMREYIDQYMSGKITEDEFADKINANIAPKLDSKEEEKKLEQGEKIYNEFSEKISALDLYEDLNDLAQKKFGVKSQEIELFKKHPVKAARAMSLAQSAEDVTNALWKAWTTWQGNGDAYRHAVWSAFMNNHIDKSFAYQESYAHEGYDVGTYSKISDLDVKMDLENNHRGRDLGDIYKANDYTDVQICDGILKSTANGRLVRIRKKTSSSNYDKSFYNRTNVKTVKMSYFIQTGKGGCKYTVC